LLLLVGTSSSYIADVDKRFSPSVPLPLPLRCPLERIKNATTMGLREF
jgi:hypothetical protein